jgi:FMN phosphatase YigB (HAD superfamily)
MTVSIQAVVFDAYGTLFDVIRSSRAAEALVSRPW